MGVAWIGLNLVDAAEYMGLWFGEIVWLGFTTQRTRPLPQAVAASASRRRNLTSSLPHSYSQPVIVADPLTPDRSSFIQLRSLQLARTDIYFETKSFEPLQE
ncbi:hypothetical protein F0562_025961 [Nyssa sinensis]|uniref:Uncharacterized protein n=1 Tax=Nyssa sinensis TaxID=561372 RepID=A0A5J5B9H7_9ASTE|nr:hypothetical protein F0562_025961 [Nyssa sinensis]